MANKAKFFNAKNKYKMLRENKQRREESLARRSAAVASAKNKA